MGWKAVAAAAVAGFALLALEAQAAYAADELSADQIVEKNVAARGGLEAWRKIDTMVWLGHVVSEHSPVPSLLFVLEQKRPNKIHFEIDAHGEKTLRVFDGTRGWKLKPGRNGSSGGESYSQQEVTFAFRAQGVDGPLIDCKAKGNTVTLESTDLIEGRKVYRLKVELASGETDHIWVDAQTFLEVRYDRPSYGPEGTPSTVTVFYRDYKTVDGLLVPGVIETSAGKGATPDRMMIEKVMLNAPLDDQVFAQPGSHRRRSMALGGQGQPSVRSAAQSASGVPPATSTAAEAGSASAPATEPPSGSASGPH